MMRLRNVYLLIGLALIFQIFPLRAQAAEKDPTVNPYCATGSRASLDKMEMPDASSCYRWDVLMEGNLFQMMRPCKFWIAHGSGHRPQGYHETTDTIDDPTYMDTWVRANPGCIWIIGNEPENVAQDNLTADQYARMYRTCREFILQRDSTARFAIAGPIGSYKPSSSFGRWPHARTWFESVLASYKSQFGTPMPVDIWNTHAYAVAESGAPVLPTPEQVCEYIIDPFIAWAQTVENGIYQDCEMMLTEMGVAGPGLTEAQMVDFMNDYCKLLEQRLIKRFFWFVAAWPNDAYWNESALIGADGNPTTLGLEYARLANEWQEWAELTGTTFVWKRFR